MISTVCISNKIGPHLPGGSVGRYSPLFHPKSPVHSIFQMASLSRTVSLCSDGWFLWEGFGPAPGTWKGTGLWVSCPLGVHRPWFCPPFHHALSFTVKEVLKTWLTQHGWALTVTVKAALASLQELIWSAPKGDTGESGELRCKSCCPWPAWSPGHS